MIKYTQIKYNGAISYFFMVLENARRTDFLRAITSFNTWDYYSLYLPIVQSDQKDKVQLS